MELLFACLDSIEAHVESAGTHVEEANVQLSKASEYQVSYVKITFYIIIGFITFNWLDQFSNICSNIMCFYF